MTCSLPHFSPVAAKLGHYPFCTKMDKAGGLNQDWHATPVSWKRYNTFIPKQTDGWRRKSRRADVAWFSGQPAELACVRRGHVGAASCGGARTADLQWTASGGSSGACVAISA